MTVAESAKKIGRSTRFVRDEIREGRLAARGRGRAIMILAGDLDAWIASQPARKVRRSVTKFDGLAVTTEAVEAEVDRMLSGLA